MKYNWLMTYLYKQGGGKPHTSDTGAISTFKPLLWYRKKGEKLDSEDKMQDVVRGTQIYKDIRQSMRKHINEIIHAAPKDKYFDANKYFMWQQDLYAFLQIVEQFSDPGDTVCDLCMGAATTGVASIVQDRCFIGCDIIPKNVEIAKSRIHDALDWKIKYQYIP
jgi:DNA modification methylase